MKSTIAVGDFATVDQWSMPAQTGRRGVRWAPIQERRFCVVVGLRAGECKVCSPSGMVDWIRSRRVKREVLK